ncbi:hypothetical protein ACHAXT_010689 [Thalassiosira profunda]
MPDSERIYIGGLDPARGLTVDLVASRLRAVRGVDVLAIDDGHRSTVIDADGDAVDTRNFFYLEARATDEKSALDAIAKQYHGAKWKGCQLRVEAARPHFLQRLEEERALRAGAEENVRELQLQVEDAENTEKEEVKQRRRLRIRRRFGEEAHHVDTRPHPLREAANHNLWGDFASLHERMTNKRHSQRKKLMERRREERRAWASGKGKGKRAPDEGAEGGDLNGLIFLNRGIHIRFGDETDGDNSGVDEGEVEGPAGRVGEESESAASSSVVSSDSDDSSENRVEARGEGKAYVWSDEDEDGGKESRHSDVSSEDDGEERDLIKEKYAWSDGEEEHDDSGSKQFEAPEKADREERSKMMDVTRYTKAAAMDEFLGGMDFGDASSRNDEQSSSAEDDAGSVVGEDTPGEGIEDGDISSNLDILSRLFPGESFDQKPLAASVADADAEDANVGVGSSKPSSVFGAGMIMQRYDPTKESDNRLGGGSAKRAAEEESIGKEEDKKDETSEEKSAADDASVSSESSDDDDAPEQDTGKEPAADTADKKARTATNVEGKAVPAKDVYDQEKLEGIFKQAREGKSESFSLANLFQGEEKVAGTEADDNEVYEQDKLENIFKHAREGGSTDAGAGGFSFGFQSQAVVPEQSASDGGTFSFGFDATNTSEDATSEPLDPDKGSQKQEAQPDERVAVEKSKKRAPTRKRRRGMMFPESDLDKYEALFFGLNEGPQIINDFQAMKHDEKSQEQWQKERTALTADWKRKQKAALSKGPKKNK